MRTRCPIWTIQKLFAMFAALSVLLAPAVASATMSASAHDRMQMQMMDGGHCQGPSNSSGHDKMGGKSCCIAMCMAVAVAPSTPAETAPVPQQVAQFAIPRAYHGLPAEIATPPPRYS